MKPRQLKRNYALFERLYARYVCATNSKQSIHGTIMINIADLCSSDTVLKPCMRGCYLPTQYEMRSKSVTNTYLGRERALLAGKRYYPPQTVLRSRWSYYLMHVLSARQCQRPVKDAKGKLLTCPVAWQLYPHRHEISSIRFHCYIYCISTFDFLPT